MRILIHDRLTPYSHTPGISCILPFTNKQFKIYPALIELFYLVSPKPKLVQQIPLCVKGPVEEFTVQLNLERGWIRVWGKALNGFFCYRIQNEGMSWSVAVEKQCTEGLFLKDIQTIGKNVKPLPLKCEERLSFGEHKAQEIEAILRRNKITEIFPFLHKLSFLLPKVEQVEGGVCDLIDELEKVIKDQSKQEIETKFKNVFATGLEGIFSPRLLDANHQGFSLTDPKGSPLWVIQKTSELIRSLFFQELDEEHAILPLVPPVCHSGKFIGVVSRKAVYDIEWTKKRLRRMVVYGRESSEISLRLPSAIRRFRLGIANDREKKVIKAGMPLLIRKGEVLELDHFEQ